MEAVAGSSSDNNKNRNCSRQPQQNQKQQHNRRNFQQKKRPAPKTYQRENDVYITSKSHFKVCNYNFYKQNICEI